MLQGREVLKRRLAILLVAPILIVSGGVPSLGVHSPTIGLDPSPCPGLTVAPGAAASYAITITNNGPTATVDPIDLTLADTDGSNFSSTVFDGGGSPITQVMLDADASVVVELRVTASAAAAYLASNVTTFTATRSDDATTNSLTCETTVAEGPAVAMTKSVDDPTPVVGQQITYTIGWDNPGPQTVTGFVATDTVDADLTFVDAGGGGVYDSGSRTITWTIGDLVAPVSGSVTFTATIDEVPDQTVIPNVANGDGTNVAAGTAGQSVTVQAPDLNITKQVSAATARPGDRLTYTISFANQGTDDLDNLVITDPIDPALIVDPASITAGGILSGGAITWSPGTLSAGSATQTVSFEATVDVVPDGTSVTNSATGDGDRTAPVASNVVVTTINSEADLSVSKTDAPDPVLAGDELVYQVTVTNLGPNDNSGFTLTDTLPTELSAIDAPGCVIVGSMVTCSSGGIAAGDTQTFTITGTVDPAVAPGTVVTNSATVATTGTADPDPSNDTASITTTVNAEADLAVGKTASADPVTAGEQLSYSVTVTNQGPSDSAGFTLTDPVPAGTTFESVGPGCSEASGTVTCTSAGLAAGASVSYAITVTVNASTPDGASITNTATTSSPATPDPDPTDDSATVVVDVVAVADLSIVKSDSPDPVTAGTQLTYSVTVTNTSGPSDNAGYSVTDDLPVGTSFSSASAGCSYSVITDTVTCTSAGLAVGASQSYTIAVDVSSVLLPGTVLTNTATIATNATTDPDASDDASTTTTTVSTSSDLALTKSDDPDPVVAGTNLTYTLTVTNLGPSANAGFSVTDTLPTGVSFVSASGACSLSAGTATCTDAGLAVGATQTYQIVVAVDASYPDGGSILNTAAISSSSTADPVAANDSASAITAVEAVADLSVVKTDSPDPVIAGTNLSYTIVVTNNGPSDNAGSTLTDPLPAGTSYVSSSLACPAVAGLVTCTSAGLAAGSSVTYTVTVAVDSAVPDGASITNTASIVASSTSDPDSSNDSDTTTTSVVAQADLGIQKLALPDPVEPTNDLTYSLVVTNNGPSDNTGFSVQDQVPSNTSFVSATSPDCAESAGVVTCTSAGLAVGASVTWTVVVNVDAGVSDASVITNTASIVATDTTDPDASNNSTGVTTTVSAPTLSLAKSADPASGSVVSPGQNITFTVTYENAGSAAATDLIVTDTVDPIFGNVVPDGGGIFDPVSRVVTWTVSTVGPGVTGTVGFTARIGSAASDRTVTNTASAIARQLDEPIESNQTSHELRLPDVVITKTADKVEGSSLKAFEIVTYTLRVENRNRRGSAFDVKTTDDLPQHLNYVPGSTTLSGVSVPDVSGTSALFGSGIDLGDLAPGAVRTITFRAQVDVAAPAGAPLENWGYVDWLANAGSPVGDFHGLRVYQPTAGPSLRQSILVQGPSGSVIFVTVFNEVLGRAFGVLPLTGGEAFLVLLLGLAGVGAGASLTIRLGRLPGGRR